MRMPLPALVLRFFLLWLAASAGPVLAQAPAPIVPDPAPAADSDRQKAAIHFDIAEKYFRIGEFARALESYQKAFELSSLPELNFNIAQCHRQLKQWEKALFFYRRFLSALPEHDQAGVARRYAAEAEKEVDLERKKQDAERRKKAGRVNVVTRPPGIGVYLDAELEKSRGNTPLTLELMQGTHRVLLKKPGMLSEKRVIDVVRDKSITLDVMVAPLGADRWLPPDWTLEAGALYSFCRARVCRLQDDGAHDGTFLGVGVLANLVHYWYGPGERRLVDRLPVRKYLGAGLDVRGHKQVFATTVGAFSGWSVGAHLRLAISVGYRGMFYVQAGAGYGHASGRVLLEGPEVTADGVYAQTGLGLFLPTFGKWGIGISGYHQFYVWNRNDLSHDPTYLTLAVVAAW